MISTTIANIWLVKIPLRGKWLTLSFCRLQCLLRVMVVAFVLW
ncbi:hypothetical protein ACLB1N_19220 [Escherichia coli]